MTFELNLSIANSYYKLVRSKKKAYYHDEWRVYIATMKYVQTCQHYSICGTV